MKQIMIALFVIVFLTCLSVNGNAAVTIMEILK